MGSEARDEGTNESDSEHPEIHQVGASRFSDDANGSIHPDEEET